MIVGRVLILILCCCAISVLAEEQVSLIPCSAVNDTTCVYKSDLVEGVLEGQGAYSLYSLDLSTLAFKDTDGLSVEVRSLSSEGANSASISVYLRKDLIPTTLDFDASSNITCLTSNCEDLSAVGVCNTGKNTLYVMIVSNDEATISYGLKFAIVDTTASSVVFDCDDEAIFPTLLFYLLSTFTTLICCLLCASFCLCCCGNSKRRRCQRSCKSKKGCQQQTACSSQVVLSINNSHEEQTPLLAPPPYPGALRSSSVQPTPPFYPFNFVPMQANNPQQFQYIPYPALYPVVPQAPPASEQ